MYIDLLTFWMCFAFACLGAYLCLSRIDTNNILFGMFSLSLFVVCGFSAMGLQTVSDGGTVTVYSYPALSILCFVCAITVMIGVAEEAFGFSIVEQYGAWK